MRRLGFECAHRRIHINEDVAYYFEITDDYGIPLPVGESGRLIVTGFENRVMPFIRYDTGDIGVIREDQCQCGRTLRTIEFQGRQAKLLHVGDARKVSLTDISVLFNMYYDAIRQYQIVRTGECSFTMRIVRGVQFDEEKTKNELMERFKFHIHPHVQIEWEIIDSIPEGPNGKAVYFVDAFNKDD